MPRRSSLPQPSQPAAPEQPPSEAPFPYRDYVRARQQFADLLRSGTFYALLVGASGTGKTSLMDDVRNDLDPHRHQLLYLSATAKASSIGLARSLARVFRVPPKRSYLETVLELLAAIKAHSTCLLLWLDEADQLPHATLSELRGLVESDGSARPIFSVVLSGLPLLRSLLDAPSLFPLRRRLDVVSVLEGLRRDELETFLLHRFGSRDLRRVPDELHDELFERTLATPALIHKAVTRALGFAGDRPLHEEHLHAALDALGL